MNDRFQTPADFFNDDSFRQWVLHPTPEADADWTAWLDAHPHQAEHVQQAKVLVRALRESLSPFSQAEAERELGRLQTSIDGSVSDGPAPRFYLNNTNWLLAAALACVLLAGYWWQSTDKPAEPPGYGQVVSQATQNMLEASNATGRPLLITLPDGSSVVLGTGAKVSFPNRFAARRREVYLSGEAFFEVAKNAKQPFFVYANEMIVKVLGTSFMVNATGNSPVVQVRVKTGRVSVFSQKDSDRVQKMTSAELSGLVLLPSQQAVLDRRTNQLEIPVSVPDAPAVLPIQSQEFSFQKTPVSEVFAALESAYGLQFVFNKKMWSDCTLTSELSDEPLAEKLKIICTALDAQYEITDREVLVRGSGCR